MKVKCITDEYYFLTKDKIYDVYLNAELKAYIFDDDGDKYLLSGNRFKSEPLEGVIQEKTLRDEFAMAVISGISSVLHDYGDDKFDNLHKREVRRAYKIADTMMKVKKEKE